MFCTNCGKEIKDNSIFCKYCGSQVKNVKSSKKINPQIYFCKAKDFVGNLWKIVVTAIKKNAFDFHINYNSLFFKFATIMLLAFGIGEPIYIIISRHLPQKALSWFSASSNLYDLGVCLILFGVFSLIILKIKDKQTIKKSKFLQVFWLVTVILNLLLYIADLKLYKYVLFSNYVEHIITILLVLSSVLLLYKNKPKNPVVLFITLMSVALQKSSIFNLNINRFSYVLEKNFENFIDIFNYNTLGLIAFVILLFLIRYLTPEKIGKWLVYMPTFMISAACVINLVEYFSIDEIFNFIINLVTIATFLLFVLSCSRNVSYNYNIENKGKGVATSLKVGVISIGIAGVITAVCLLTSAIVCGVQINTGMEKWSSKISTGSINTSQQWMEVRKDLRYFQDVELAKGFIDDYSAYESIKENIGNLERITECYNSYKSARANYKTVEEYSKITVYDYWENDSVLGVYYERYIRMKPKKENVDVSMTLDTNSNKITITVKNNNSMPISACNVSCSFTIGFVETGYYSDVEYGRGNKSYTVEKIAGNSKVTESFNFNTDDYYKGYGSYLLTFVQNSSITIQSIE